MYIGEVLLLSNLMKDPNMLRDVEDPYILLVEDERFLPDPNHKDMMRTINRLFVQGWDTVNMTFQDRTRLSALLLNPRANPKYQPGG